MNHMRHGWIRLAAVLVLALIPGAMVLAQNNDGRTVDAAGKKLMAANGLYQRGLYKLACEEYEEFLKTYPKHAKATDARYAYAVCRYRLREYDKAIPLFEKVLQDNRFDKRDEAMTVLGHSYLTSGRNEKALGVFNQLLKQFPQSRHVEVAEINRAQVLYLLNRYAEAMQACSQFLLNRADSARTAQVQYLMARCQQALNQPADAVATLNTLLGEHADYPQRFDALLLIGQCYEQMGEYEQAINQYRRIVEQGPKARQAVGWYSMGVAYNLWQQHDKAIHAFNKVIREYSGSRYADAARLDLGLVQFGAGRMDKARKTFANVVQHDKARADMARYYLAQCDISDRQYKAARDKLNELIQKKHAPANLNDILYDYARCTLALKEYQQAADRFDRFIERFPNDAHVLEARYHRAFCLHKLGQYERSLELCERILKQTTKPEFGVVELRAENLFLLGRYDQASKAIVDAMRVEKDLARQWRLSLQLSRCAYFQKNYRRAVEVLRPMLADKQLENEVNLQRGVFLLGDAQLQIGQNAEAVETLSRYLAVSNQKTEEARYKLGLAHLRNGQPDQAIGVFQELVGGNPKQPWVVRGRYELGQLFYNRDKHSQAEPLLKQVSEQAVAPDLRAPALYVLACIAMDAGEHEKAANLFGQAVRRYGGHEQASEAAYFQAECFRLAGKNDRALKLLQQYIVKHKNSERIPQAKYLMGFCHSRMNQPEQAMAILKPLADDRGTVNDNVLYELAWVQRTLKKEDRAIASYRRLLADYSDSALAMTTRTELADLLYDKHKFAEAAKLLKQVLACDGIDETLRTRSLFKMGWCCVRLEQPDRVIEHFTRFIEASDDADLKVSAIYEVGQAHASSGQYDQAVAQFQRIISRYGKHEWVPLAMLKLGEVQAAAGWYDQSKATYEQFLSRFQDSTYRFLAQFGIGWALENLKQYDPARQWYAKVVEHHNGPTTARSQFQIGETYFAEGAYERAARELLKVDIVYDYPEWSAKALYEAGRAFQQIDQPDKAKAQFRQCVNKYEDESVADLAKKALEQMKP